MDSNSLAMIMLTQQGMGGAEAYDFGVGTETAAREAGSDAN